MENRDENLWRIAKKRAGFKKHLASYIIVNGFLWALWFFTNGVSDFDNEYNGVPWPIWCSLSWGVGLAFNYYSAYMENKDDDILREYQKLKDREGRNQV
ncbi:MAG TPA: 2TM domain-containing protein [Bacteroidia bacterium]|jgi:hypothetical protein